MNSLGFNKSNKDTKVVVAMSGGVDSSVVAALMKEEGYNVTGITLKLYDDTKQSKEGRQCCAGQDILDAKRVSEKINIEHKILFYQKKFKSEVIDSFIDSYSAGETPIPCVQCNSSYVIPFFLHKSGDHRRIYASRHCDNNFCIFSRLIKS